MTTPPGRIVPGIVSGACKPKEFGRWRQGGYPIPRLVSSPINGHNNRPIGRSLDKPAISGSGRRRTGRRLQEALESNLGPILDISAGGVRVLCNREYDGACMLDIQGHETQVSVKAQVVWCRRLGFRRFELGLEFQDVGSELAQQLTDIASAHAVAENWNAA